MMRLVFLIILLVGAAAGIGYPWAVSNVAGYEIGAWRVYARGAGFSPAETNLAAPEAPIWIVVDLRSDGPLTRSEGRPLLVMQIAGADGEPVRSTPLDFADAEARTINPQTGETGYRAAAGKLETVEQTRYRFSFEPGGAAMDGVLSADLILNAGAFDLDPRAIPIGFIMMAVGAVGFAATFLRRRRENPNSKPPPRWGRGN